MADYTRRQVMFGLGALAAHAPGDGACLAAFPA
jgi:hypothetical protein